MGHDPSYIGRERKKKVHQTFNSKCFYIKSNLIIAARAFINTLNDCIPCHDRPITRRKYLNIYENKN